MIDKDILINDLEKTLAEARAMYMENDQDAFYGGTCSALQEVIKLVGQQVERYEWMDPDIVPVGEDYILLSFANFPTPIVGRYEEDEYGGGAYYIGDEEEACITQDIFVNAWMPLPKPYRED